MDSGNQTPVDQVKDSHPTVVTNAATGEGASSVLKEGDLVAQKYKAIKLLGHGGMGSVYKVEQILFRIRIWRKFKTSVRQRRVDPFSLWISLKDKT